MSIKIVIAILLCTSYLKASGQPVAARFETIGVNEGLSHSSVYSILQDRDGFMWFGTANGLNRYDGYTVNVYKAEEKLEDPGNSSLIRGKLVEDGQSNVWFTTETGLYYFDRIAGQIKSYWRFPKMKSGLLYYELVSMDAAHQLWLFNKAVGLVAVNISTGHVQRFGYPFLLSSLNTTLSDAIADEHGNIWFSLYRGQGFYCFDVKTKKLQRRFSNRDYFNVFFGRHENYLLTKGTIYKTNKQFQKTDSLQLGFVQTAVGNVHNIYEDAAGRVWLPSLGNGLFCYDFGEHKSYAYSQQNTNRNTRPGSLATVVACDRSQNLWIGTDGGGVSKLDLKPSRFNLFPVDEEAYPLRDYFIKCIYEENEKRIWFGTNSSGLGIYNPVTRQLQMFSHNPKQPGSIPGNNVSAIFRDRDSNFWVGCDLGIAIFNKRKNQFEKITVRQLPRLTPGVSFVFDFHQVHNGDILVSTTHGIFRIKKNQKAVFTAVPEFTTSIFWCTKLVEAGDGSLWVTAPLNGLFHTNYGMGKDSVRIKEKFFSGIDLRSLHQDKRNSQLLWIASGKGLICFNTKTHKFRLYNESDGMANSYVYGVLEDDAHNLWMSTNGGLSFFNRSTGHFENFTVHDGLQSNEFNTGAFFKGASGNFYFGGVKGFNWFRSAFAAKLPQQQPGIVLTRLLVNDQPMMTPGGLHTGSEMKLAHNQNNLAFDIAPLDFTSPAANKIVYRLDGWDHDWITTQARTIRYSNLLPGHYRMRVKALNGEGVFSSEKKFAIFIQAPFWQHGWFFFSLGLVTIALVVLVTVNLARRKYRERLRSLEKQRAIEAERNRISKDMHDEIGSGLTQIALLGELVQTQEKPGEDLKKDVRTIAGAARKLVESMSEIIWALNPQNDTLENLLAYLREQTRESLEPFDICFHIDFPDRVPMIHLGNEERRNLFLVTKEAVNNALKHAGATQIKIAMQYQNNSICFCVSDDGKGMEGISSSVSSNGLKNMHRRMEDIGGSFDLQSGACGTEVRYRLTVQPRHLRTTFFTSGGNNT